MPNFAFYSGHKQTKRRNFISLFELEYGPSELIPGRFAYVSQSKWVGIIAIKTERAQILFLSNVLVAVALLDLKVHNNWTVRAIASAHFFFTSNEKTLGISCVPKISQILL